MAEEVLLVQVRLQLDFPQAQELLTQVEAEVVAVQQLFKLLRLLAVQA